MKIMNRTNSTDRTDIDDDGKLFQRWQNKRVNAKKEGIYFNLSFTDYIELVREAGLKSSQLGFTGEKYVLARYGDTGGYTKDNCRFLTQKENAAEKIISEKSREASRQNVKKAYESLQQDPLRNQKISEGIRRSDSYKKRVAEAEAKRSLYEATKDKRYSGEHNSQFGTFWITNGVINKKWSPSMGELPKGFCKGRITK